MRNLYKRNFSSSRHSIFAFRKLKKVELYDASLCKERWHQQYSTVFFSQNRFMVVQNNDECGEVTIENRQESEPTNEVKIEEAEQTNEVQIEEAEEELQPVAQLPTTTLHQHDNNEQIVTLPLIGRTR